MLNQAQKKIPILMYHSIAWSSNPNFKKFTVSPVTFAEQMAYLYAQHYTSITVTRLVDARSSNTSILPEKPVVLTFDDGFVDFFTDAFPVLKRYNFVATLYMPTAYVGGTSCWLQHEGEADRPMLTWEQLTEISGNGIECGAHSHTHPQLDILPRSAVWDEIMQSKRLLENALGQRTFSFAYPFGYHSHHVRQLVREAGYTSACAVRHKMSSRQDDPFALARLMVSTDSHLDTFDALLTGRDPSFGAATYKMYTRMRTPVWQFVRRSSTSLSRCFRGGFAP